MRRPVLKKSDQIKHEISAIRLMLNREPYLPPDKQFQDPEYKTDVRKLVVLIDSKLNSMGIDHNERRKARLELLSRIVQRPVGTTYELSRYEINTIYKELSRNLTESGGSLFEYFAQVS